MTSNRRTHRVRKFAAGVGVAGAAAVIGLTTAVAAHADDLLGEATIYLTDANQALNDILSSQIQSLVLIQFQELDAALTSLSTLAGAENSISSFDNGEFVNLATPLFTDLNENWLQSSEAVLNADTALDAAIASGTGVNAAELGVLLPDLQLIGDVFTAGAIEQTAGLLSSF